jgi:hypothetical protein
MVWKCEIFTKYVNIDEMFKNIYLHQNMWKYVKKKKVSYYSGCYETCLFLMGIDKFTFNKIM